MNTHDYKGTLNLPKTGFSMKASLSEREPSMLKTWEEEGLHAAIAAKGRGRPRFVLHDGPPYANGVIHMGHALNKTLKDIVVKYKTMRGFDSPFVPGWDCHGLPVEHQLFKELGIRKHEIPKVEFRRKARDYALKYVAIQREEFKRLGIFGDWDHPYLTLDPSYQAAIIECFCSLYLDGYIYRGMKPIHWCATCETALAEAEVEYSERRSPSIYVAFPSAGGLGKIFPGAEDASFLIWTTTPWTLPANRAVAVGAGYEYAAVSLGDRRLVVLKELVERVAAELGGGPARILGVCRGRDLEGLAARHPLDGREVPVVLSDHVTVEQGTGVVHIAPGHGDEDYRIGTRHGLEVFAPVNEKGVFTAGAPEWEGLHVFAANEKITARLAERGALLAAREVAHSYPHCWRCRKPVIFRATTQWFIGVDRHGLRARALEAVDAVAWIPPRGRNRIRGMIEGRPDWCLSRQRYWGVPIPILYCDGCGGEVLTPGIAAIIRREVAARGADAWFTDPPEKFLPPGFSCPSCGGGSFRKEEDIIDVWFDSGVSHQAVLAARPGLGYPCALYLEGSDQHRGWFQTSLLTSVALRGGAPFAEVLTHGFITDGEGRKMSKSAGNVMVPQAVIGRYGADILRLWTASVDYTADVRISGEILAHLVDAYRRIRNTFRFILGNLFDFSPDRDAVPAAEREEIDRWILSRAQGLIGSVTAAFDRYDFSGVYHQIHGFCAVDLSSLYLDVLKDRLYVGAAAGRPRRSAQTAMAEILESLVRMAAPVLAFTAEEAWRAMPARVGRPPSVHLAEWPVADPSLVDPSLEAEWEALLGVRREVSKALEVARRDGMIGAPLEAEVRIAAPDPGLAALLARKAPLLPDLCIVSRVTLGGTPEAGAGEGIEVRVSPAPGDKCARCWRYCTSVGAPGGGGLCARCAGIVGRGGG